MGATKRIIAGLVAATALLTACGGGDTSSGRTRNATVGDETAKCVTASAPYMNSSGLEVSFCQEAVQAQVFYGETSPATVIIPESRKWLTNDLDLTGVTSIRVQSLDASGKV